MGAFAMTPQRLEEDILDFLQAKYAAVPGIKAMLGERQRSPVDGFASWCAGLEDGGAVTPEDAAMLRSDVMGILRSIIEPPRGFACR